MNGPLATRCCRNQSAFSRHFAKGSWLQTCFGRIEPFVGVQELLGVGAGEVEADRLRVHHLDVADGLLHVGAVPGDVGVVCACQVQRTSSAVSGTPSLQTAFLRRWKVSVLWSSDHSQDSASWGAKVGGCSVKSGCSSTRCWKIRNRTSLVAVVGGEDQLVERQGLGGPAGDDRAAPPGLRLGPAAAAVRPADRSRPLSPQAASSSWANRIGRRMRIGRSHASAAPWYYGTGASRAAGRAGCYPFPEMKRAASLGLSRRLLIASAVFGLFVLLHIALFGWLIFRSLSQREIERVLLETREEAETLARQIAGRAERQGKDLYTAVAVERETQTYIDSILRQRDIVRQVEIRDKNGVLVFQSVNQASVREPGEGGPALVPGTSELPGPAVPNEEKRTADWTATYEVPDVRVPIGDLGLLQIGISAPELSQADRGAAPGADPAGGGDRRRLGRPAGHRLCRRLAAAAAGPGGWRCRRPRPSAWPTSAPSPRVWRTRSAIRSTRSTSTCRCWRRRSTRAARRPPASGCCRSPAPSSAASSGWSPTSWPMPSPARWSWRRSRRSCLLERVPEVLAGEIQKRRARVEVEDRSGGARVRVDPAQMNQLLLNLAQNALARRRGGGPDAGPASCRSTARAPGSRSGWRTTAWASSAEELPRIFDLFYSTRKGGTGPGARHRGPHRPRPRRPGGGRQHPRDRHGDDHRASGGDHAGGGHSLARPGDRRKS